MSSNLATAWLEGWAYTPNREHWHTAPWPSAVTWIAVFPRPKHKHSNPATTIRHLAGYFWQSDGIETSTL